MVKKLLTYLLLLNFLNTVCFPQVKANERSGAAGSYLADSQVDEIDSMLEFVAEYCLEMEDDFSGNMEETDTDPLKSQNLFKDYLLPETFAFWANPYFSVVYSRLQPGFISITWPEIDSPPPRFSLV